jgi:hypothetical protein
MRIDEEVSGSGGKAELPDGDRLSDPLILMQKAETAIPESEQIDEYDEEKQGKAESWHTFKTS